MRRRSVHGLLFTAATMIAVLFLGGTASAQEATSQDTSSTSTESGGDADVATGDAGATGNGTGTGVTQTADGLKVEGNNGSVQIIDQDANVSNSGSATANTGENVSTGNASANDATGDQTASTGGSDSGVANNTSDTTNSSGGTAGITTGDASATGNSSSTTVNQVATCDAMGGLGGVCIINQDADVSNSGSAAANTGGNTATGNASTNAASSAQDASGDGSVASNSALTSNSSDGTADITTGNANATGNASTTGVNQIANATIGGSLGGIVIVNQSANVSNTGTAEANTGGNTATGNESTNLSNAVQGAVSGAGPPDGSSVATNDGVASNWSDGTADITTGAATATGNASQTNITQAAYVTTTGQGGVVLVNQDADVDNTGAAFANSGGNEAVGNASFNDADTHQVAETDGGDADNSVAANFGAASNTSDGSAYITTGAATATGNASSTYVTQIADVETEGLAFVDQDTDVVNHGVAEANSGFNFALGNHSFNDADVLQDADSDEADGSSVASNFGESSNDSDGSASIMTGAATATGNASTTTILQSATVDGAHLSFVDQDADVTNVGAAAANSGFNAAIGNLSLNDADSHQVAGTSHGGSTVVASNFGSASNASDGTAQIWTGPAKAVGNSSTTSIGQVAEVSGDGDGFAVIDQDADVLNHGVAEANSGFNFALGNHSDNDADNLQDADTGSSEENSVAANFGTASNTSDGTATIDTGDATAIGNWSETNIGQLASADIGGDGFAVIDQDAIVHNVGAAAANSGFNAAIGNLSLNDADNHQVASVDEGEGAVVASNDGQALNDSNGTASIVTGCACAIGNRSTTSIGQAAIVDIGGDGFALVDQDADVLNHGVAEANSGFNFALGNASLNGAFNLQGADVSESGSGSLNADDVVASNIAETANTSDGTASITTGDATAIGNDAASTTNIGQLAAVDIGGHGFALVDQDADVINVGAAAANSGFNAAVGNASLNLAFNHQVASVSESGSGSLNADDVVARNLADTRNDSDGSAWIQTGQAGAVGNAAETNIGQVADVAIGDDGFALVDQDADVLNHGVAEANSGFNFALGNASLNEAVNLQGADVSESGSGSLNADDVVASNVANTVNESDGTADISTGAAIAYGNVSGTNIGQVADVDVEDGFALIDQDVVVHNVGAAAANSGFNAAIGNLSLNFAANIQFADVTESGPGSLNADDVVASNVANTVNESDGDATITTGAATAVGNWSGTDVVQAASCASGAFCLIVQSVGIVNAGVALANTGFNLAEGNDSLNFAGNLQFASATGGSGDQVASNVGGAVNSSGGSSSITTGPATAFGNVTGGAPDLPPLPFCPKDEEQPPPEQPPGEQPPGEQPPGEEPVVEPVSEPTPASVGGGDELPVTGASVALQALFGLLLLALGALLRRKAEVA